MAPPLLTLEDISLTFGGDALFTAVSLAVGPRERIALVGRNGSGKSTLMKIIAGSLEADGGKRFVDPGASVLYLPQEPDLTGFATVDDYLAAAEAGATHGADRHQLAPLMAALNISGGLEIAALSGGEARKVALIRALAHDPDILMLDEPTNHLDIAAIEWLEARLAGLRSSLIVISHDRQFLETLTRKVIWLDRGVARTRAAGFKGFEDWRDKVLEEEASEHHKLGRKIVAEEHWLRYGVTARRKRNVGRLRQLHALRSAHKDARQAPQNVTFSVNSAAPSGKAVIEAEAISKSFGEQVIVRDFSVRITRGERVGFVGPNGAGKTTLLNLLTGALAPDSGRVKLGTTLNIVSLDQRRESLRPGMRVSDAITDGRGDFVTFGGVKRHVASYLKDFLFVGEQWRMPVQSLSGGERGRLALAAALAKPSNLLVLDEPTNDLDLETLDLLQDMLGDYPGTLILVSHDRSFLDRTVSCVIAPAEPAGPARPAGQWIRYAGGYSDMRRQCEATAPAPARSPKPSDRGKPASPARAPARKTRLSYKEKFALETLPDKITALEQAIKASRAILAQADLFQRDPEKFTATVATLEHSEAALKGAEDQWLELEMKRESMDGQG